VSTGWGAVLLIAAVLAGLQAGTYYTWATGVMPGLARTDDRTFVHATQQMSIAIVNPAFMLSFLGAPLFAVAAIVGAEPVPRRWALAGAALEIGTLVITAIGNIPLNNQIEAAGPVDSIADLPSVRGRFETRWVAFNTARSFTSLGAMACLVWAAYRA